MNIISTPDPRLRKKSVKVRKIDDRIHDIIAKMIQASLKWEDQHDFEISSAMAAPQIGFNDRIVIIREDTSDKSQTNFIALINPEIIKNEGKPIKDYEGCLSVPNIYGLIPRYPKTRIKALLEDGSEIRIKANDFLARTLQHEIDHLDGVLFVDYIKGQKEAFFKLDDKGDLIPLDYDNEVLPISEDLFNDEE